MHTSCKPDHSALTKQHIRSIDSLNRTTFIEQQVEPSEYGYHSKIHTAEILLVQRYAHRHSVHFGSQFDGVYRALSGASTKY